MIPSKALGPSRERSATQATNSSALPGIPTAGRTSADRCLWISRWKNPHGNAVYLPLSLAQTKSVVMKKRGGRTEDTEGTEVFGVWRLTPGPDLSVRVWRRTETEVFRTNPKNL